MNKLTAFLASLCFRFPSRSLTLVGVAGSEGRVETAEYIYSILRQTGQDVGIITSRRQARNEEEVAYYLRIKVDRPKPFKLQRLLRELVYRGCTFVILEVLTEALADGRMCGMQFKVAVLASLGHHHHLSRHVDSLTRENGLRAQCRLFRKTPLVILNKDALDCAFLTRIACGERITYGIHNEAQIKALKVQSGDWGTFFYFINKDSVWRSQLSFDRSIKLKQQDTNLIPCALAAVGTAVALSIPEFRIKKGLETARDLR